MAYDNANLLRAIPTFRPAGLVFGPSATDRLVGVLRGAIGQRDGYCTPYGVACAKLAWANRTKAAGRRVNQGIAMRGINAARATIRARVKAVVTARTALLAKCTSGSAATEPPCRRVPAARTRRQLHPA